MNAEEPKKDFVGYRCLIQGRLKTASFLHIGSEKPVVVRADDAPGEGDPDLDTGADEATDREAHPSSVVVGSNGKAVIPATALRGAIRSRLMRLSEKLGKDLMGTAYDSGDADATQAPYQAQDAQADSGRPGEQKDKQTGTGSARRVFIQTAAIVEPCPATIVFDKPSRCVDIIAMTAMSRWRRAPQNEMLRSVEAVPPGVEFSVSIGISGSQENKGLVTADEVAAVLWSLGCRQDDSSGQTAPPPENGRRLLRLGAFQKSGWGRVEWTTCKITSLSEHGLQRWLAAEPNTQAGAQGWAICSEPVDVKRVWSAWKQGPNFAIKDAESRGRDLVTLSLTLHCQSTFFTEDQRFHTKDAATKAAALAAENDTDNIPAKLAKVMRVDGKAWLSGQSLKGALRSQFERILRTRGIPCCDPTFVKDKEQLGSNATVSPVANQNTANAEGSCLKHPDGLTRPRCSPIHNANEVGSLCLACQIFGAGGWASTIDLSEFHETETSLDVRREFLAISRFTGGGVTHLKFSSDVAVQPSLRGSIRIHIDRLSFQPKEEKDRVGIPSLDAKLGALLHLFRDFTEGDIPIGAGRSKGFGAFKVEAPNTDSSQTKQACVAEAIRLLLAKPDRGSAGVDCYFDATQETQKTVETWMLAFDKAEWLDVLPSDNWRRRIALDAENPNYKWGYGPDWWNPEVSNKVRVNQNLPNLSITSSTKMPGSYNPYHWVPAASTPNKLRTAISVLKEKMVNRHDVYAPDGLSGELRIRVTTVTPIFVGGEKKPAASGDESPLVVPYCVAGRPAIPSTSLRGLLSTTYEIATGSAMRVLDAKKIYSFRMDVNPKCIFHMIGKVSQDGNSIEPWNQRPADQYYAPTGHISSALAGLPPWIPVRMRDLRQNDQLPDVYRLKWGASTKKFPSRTYEIRLSPPRPNPFTPIPISQEAREQFERLAEECGKAAETEKTIPRPYEPQGQDRGDRALYYTLKSGDFVYFQTNPTATHVTRLSLAQIWRDDVKKTIGEKFGNGELSPITSTRGHLTPVEKAFGFVQADKAHGSSVQAFSSKLILSDAVLVSSSISGTEFPSASRETLKILSSPKPPSPAFYFEPVNGELPKYETFAEGNYTSRGRKFYLHLHPDSAASRPWKTSPPPLGSDRPPNYDQKVQVQCLEAGKQLDFSIAFDNLTLLEFFSLCYAIRPKEMYLHKIGLAKPLGLGSIALNPLSVLKVDRIGRYTAAGFAKPRFIRVDDGKADWIDHRSLVWRSQWYGDVAMAKALTALETIGTTQVGSLQYPMAHNQTDTEDKLYEWPSENRTMASNRSGVDGTQFLRPILPGGGLYPFPWKCYLIAICDGANIQNSMIHSIENLTCGFYPVGNAAAANARITAVGLDAFSAGSVIFVVGTSAQLENVVSNGQHVRKVRVGNVAIACPIQGAMRNSDQKTLDKLKRALMLGARP